MLFSPSTWESETCFEQMSRFFFLLLFPAFVSVVSIVASTCLCLFRSDFAYYPRYLISSSRPSTRETRHSAHRSCRNLFTIMYS